tara:strand:- start:3660 stop:4724 length:1065 start_codon:yes stop_codon:yes gene_type:complete
MDFFDDILGPLLGIGGVVGGGLLSAQEYERLGDIGEQALVGTTLDDGTKIPGAIGLAQDALTMSQFRPFTVTSTIPGSEFRATRTVDPETGAITGTGTEFDISPEEKALQSAMLTRAQTQLTADPYGQARGRTASRQAFGLGKDLMTSLGTTDMAQREEDIYGRIRATQTPEEERQRLALEERLASQGRLGVRTSMFGGTPEAMAMEKAQAEARNTAMLQAMAQAQAEQAQQAAQAQAFTGLGSQLAQTDLAQRAAQQNLAMASLGGAYVPQTQLMQLQQAMQPYQQQQQAGQLFGAGQYGETMMSGLEARLVAEQARANLLGSLGTGLLGGLLGPVTGDEGTYKIPLLDLFGL